MSAYVVTVEFLLKPGMRAAFRPLIDANARASAREEAGCRRFDVVEPKDQPDRIFLYEIYADRAAFEIHLQSEHYLRFDRESAGLVAGKSVTTGELVCEGSA